MIWLYLALALVTATGVFLVGTLLTKHSAKRQIGAWVCLVTGVCMFLFYALDSEHNPFMLAGGLTAFVFAVVALIRATVKRST